jgi:hypothetical protein
MFDNSDLRDKYEIDKLKGKFDNILNWKPLKHDVSPLARLMKLECPFLNDLKCVDNGKTVTFLFNSIDKGYNEDEKFYYFIIEINYTHIEGLFDIKYSYRLSKDDKIITSKVVREIDVDTELLSFFIRNDIYHELIDFNNLVTDIIGDSNFYIKDKKYLIYNPIFN